MTFIKFKLTCNCEPDGTEMFLAEDDMAWVFECPKCQRQVAVENWTTDEEEKK